MATADITLRPKKSTFTELVRAIKTNPPAMFSLFIVFLYVFVGLFGSMIAPF